MKPIFFAFVLVGLGVLVRAEDVFRLDFEATPENGGHIFLTLSHAGSGLGAAGWSAGVTADKAQITGISVDGTPAAQALSNGFVAARLTAGPGNEGAVLAVVLSFVETLTLPANATSRIGWIDIDAPGGGFVTLQYVDGLHLEGSPGVLNSINQEGKSVTPLRSSRTVEIAPCTKLHVGFSTERVSSPEPFAGMLGDKLTGAGGELFSESGQVTLFANIVSQLERGGVQGWSLSLRLKGDGDFSSVTTEGTAAAPSPDGYRSRGFERTEVIDPGRNGGRKGVVSAVILSLEPDVHLPLAGTESVLKLGLLLSSPTKKDLSVVLSFTDGLAGTGQPVSNLMSVEDDDFMPCNSRTASVTVKSARVPFIRGDSNINGRVTIADAVFTLGHLFLGRHADTPCRKALDANGDGAVNISDPMYTLAHLFLGGPPISAPYPSCGNETTPDSLSCTIFNACQ